MHRRELPRNLCQMVFQYFLKGIARLDDDAADLILRRTGLICRWWQTVDPLPWEEIGDRLTPENLETHLDRYDSIDPSTGAPFADASPFISLSAGTILREAAARGIGGRNRRYSARWTALRYATDNFKTHGHIFRGWVVVLPNPSLRLKEFAEDVRDVHSYHRYRAFHRQGEVTAKIEVPAVHLESVERWELNGSGGASLTGNSENPSFEPPSRHANIRDVL
jgi:hypothetical protein